MDSLWDQSFFYLPDIILQSTPTYTYFSMQLLSFSLLIRWLAPEPYPHKRHPPYHCNPDPGNPYPSTADHPTPWPLVVSKVPDRDLLLNVDICQKWAFVVDPEGEYAMLVRESKSCTEDGAVGSGGNRLEVETVEGGKHCEF